MGSATSCVSTIQFRTHFSSNLGVLCWNSTISPCDSSLPIFRVRQNKFVLRAGTLSVSAPPPAKRLRGKDCRMPKTTLSFRAFRTPWYIRQGTPLRHIKPLRQFSGLVRKSYQGHPKRESPPPWSLLPGLHYPGGVPMFHMTMPRRSGPLQGADRGITSRPKGFSARSSPPIHSPGVAASASPAEGKLARGHKQPPSDSPECLLAVSTTS
jgi:hypothetical protein